MKHAGVSIEVATTRKKDHSDKIHSFSLGSATFGLRQQRQTTMFHYCSTIISGTKAFVGREQEVNKVGAFGIIGIGWHWQRELNHCTTECLQKRITDCNLHLSKILACFPGKVLRHLIFIGAKGHQSKITLDVVHKLVFN